MTRPTPPIELTGARPAGPAPSTCRDAVLDELAAICPSSTTSRSVAERSRDWWPLALHWSLAGEVPRRAAVAVRPAVDRAGRRRRPRRAPQHALPLTAAGGRSGVTRRVGAGVRRRRARHHRAGRHRRRRRHVGRRRGARRHVRARPRATSCRSATGSASATSRRASTSPPSAAGSPAAAPGSTRPATARSRTSSSASRSCSPTARSCAPAARRPPPSAPTSPSCSSAPRARSASSRGCGCGPTRGPPAERRAAYTFASFADGIEACRRVLQRGATPAVLRLYDGVESARGHGGDGTACVLLVLDEGDPAIVDATMASSPSLRRRRAPRPHRSRSSPAGSPTATTRPRCRA